MRLRFPVRKILGRPKWPRPSKVAARSTPIKFQEGWIETDGTDVHLVALNEKMAMKLKLTRDDNYMAPLDVEVGMFPAEALGHVERTRGKFEIRATSIEMGRASYNREPDWPGDKVQPSMARRWPPKRPKNALRLAFDTAALSALAEGLGAESVMLTIDLDKLEKHGDGHITKLPIDVKAVVDGGIPPDHRAFIMPVRPPVVE